MPKVETTYIVMGSDDLRPDKPLPKGFAYIEGAIVYPAPPRWTWWRVLLHPLKFLRDMAYEASRYCDD